MEKKSSFSNGDELSTKAIAGKLDVNIPYDWKSLKEDVFVSKVIGVKGQQVFEITHINLNPQFL